MLTRIPAREVRRASSRGSSLSATLSTFRTRSSHGRSPYPMGKTSRWCPRRTPDPSVTCLANLGPAASLSSLLLESKSATPCPQIANLLTRDQVRGQAQAACPTTGRTQPNSYHHGQRKPYFYSPQSLRRGGCATDAVPGPALTSLL